MTNHNVETCRKKKEQTLVPTIEATKPSQKPQKTSSYGCHICGDAKDVSWKLYGNNRGSTCCWDTNNHCIFECGGC